MLRKVFSGRKYRHIKDEELGYNDIVNIYRYNTKNTGDIACAPYLYFSQLGTKKMDVLGIKEEENSLQWINEVSKNNLVVGGGGMLDRKSLKHSVEYFLYLAEKGRKVVFWGVGHNDPKMKAINYQKYKYGQDLSKIKMFGTRDVNNYEWVPCVSCMSPEFDRKYELKQEVGILKHTGFNNLPETTYPVMYNNRLLEDVIKFIGESKYIVTDSYHGMYWAILMKKRVLVVPNSSKMFNFMYPVPLTDFNSFENDFAKAQVYDDGLEICRERNVLFSEKVFDYLGL